MKHFGDITKINGYDVPVVDIVTGGSPCQDLSVAGRRAGLAGERSGLFMEQIRIIKEMRKHYVETNGLMGVFRTGKTEIKPRYMVWENVPGALSSNNGEDFRCVLEETAKIADENAVIPKLAKGQKWSYAGCIMGDGWSLAWRITDNQFWGTPQRRRRVALVADFGGKSAPEILFERKGMSGNTNESEQTREKVARSVGESFDRTNSYTLKIRGGVEIDSFGKRAGKGALIQKELSATLGVSQDQTLFDARDCVKETIGALCARDYKGVGNQYVNEGKVVVQEKLSFRKTAHPQTSDGVQGWEHSDINDTLNVYDNSEFRTPTLILENHPQDSRVKIKEDNIFQTLSSRMGTGGNNVPMLMNENESIMIVRRLTPKECERLQNFPDDWTNIGEWIDSKGKLHKDSDAPRYKALGNSIALPFWDWLAERICNQYDRPVEMASLFDGIGGFPFVFEKHDGKAVWASEIEEFPIAVTKLRFPDKEGEAE